MKNNHKILYKSTFNTSPITTSIQTTFFDLNTVKLEISFKNT